MVTIQEPEGTYVEPHAFPADEDAEVASNRAPKRTRWATQRHPGARGHTKRDAILRRLSQSIPGHHHQPQRDAEQDAAGGDATARRVFFNMPLPDDARDEHGHPTAQYPRNKIRTARYTPLSFIPKDLYFQFHNIANLYFLFIDIIAFFSIFGVQNPGLNTAPLIVIVVLTGIKDAIEDYRRTTVDNELNNAPTHRLVDIDNVNTMEDNVSLWRRFKKACTRFWVRMWRLMKRTGSKKHQGEKHHRTFAENAVDARPSGDTRRESMFSHPSTHFEQSNPMELTPVGTPSYNHHGPAELYGSDPMRGSLDVPRTSMQKQRPGYVVRKFGSLVDPNVEAPGKARFKKDTWKSVQVGDFIRLYNNEQIPADIVVLSTSDHDGVCYVETKNLDGETNLKVRNAMRCGEKIRRARDCERTHFVVESEPPHANLYSYSGVLRWVNSDPSDPEMDGKEMAEPIGINNMLLRGCSVKNTDWVLGVVIFTGVESKIMLNSGITPSKRAKISKSLNYNVLWNFFILFCMCLVSGIVEGTTWAKGHQSLDFFEYGNYGGSPAVDGLITFFAAVILYQNLVPISLYITLEIIRVAQAFFIYSDSYMYYDKLDYPCTPRTWNISDDLGQIEYIFSDKTGTLTQNVMEFKKATINGVPYGEAYTEALAGMRKREGIDVEAEAAKAHKDIAEDRVRMLGLLREVNDNPYLHDDELTFVAPDFVSDLKGDAGDAQKRANEDFMLALALCHTVIADRVPGEIPRIEFKAQSPDEAALVATAKDCGWTVLPAPTNSDELVLDIQGKETHFQVLNTLEFNSARKRMSIIIRMPNGKIRLYSKGADSIIYSRLKSGEQSELRKATAEHLEMFAREGLRTLCIAQRDLSDKEYTDWARDHEIAAAAVKDREEKIEEVSDRIERDLTLLGGTAIEDRLQDGVPDAIALLGRAGIKLWVLTGDKVETAINIGFSCNLLDNDMQLLMFKVDEGNVAQAEAELDKHLAAFGKTGSDEELKIAKDNHEAPPPTHAVVIDGDTLRLVLDDRLRQKFLLLCKECKSVLCCRVSPSQKAAVVSMVKNGLDVITLAIGDGANDVSMIQEAHVGVGIAGEEGRQAVMSADYAVGQFRFLSRLLLVHGRWSYRRLAETISNFFYKNVVWTFALFWGNIYANFDCVYIFDYTYILLYNLAFTSLPIIFMGILDQDVSDKVSMAVPGLYRRGIERKEWTAVKFWFYMADGLYQSAICFFMPYLLFHVGGFVTESGQNVNDYKSLGVYIANATVIVVNIYILMNTYRWDWFFCLFIGISILLIFFWTGVYTSFSVSYIFYQAGKHCYGQLSFWCVTLLTVIVALMPRFAIKSFQKIFLPMDIDIVREEVRQGKFDYLNDVDPTRVGPLTVKMEAGLESASSSSELGQKNRQQPHHRDQSEDRRPFYAPSVATNPNNGNSPQGSEGTIEYASLRDSWDRAYPPTRGGYDSHRAARPPAVSPVDSEMPPAAGRYDQSPRISFDRPRPSFDRLRSSMERSRTNPALVGSTDFTSAAYLARVESTQTHLRHQHNASDEQG